jgi:hypothetical protein
VTGAHAASGERFEPFTYTAQGDEDIGEMFNMALIEYAHMIYIFLIQLLMLACKSNCCVVGSQKVRF